MFVFNSLEDVSLNDVVLKTPAELKEANSDAAPEEPNMKLIFAALLEAEKSPSEITLTDPAN